ncbi:hypothetical protein BH18ACT10_BH18ACT10_14470 [soil metagenome]|jgi:ATP-dependent protease HslVU (ClpYQ) ATPase subunit
MNLEYRVLETENLEALAWLDRSLEQARDRGQRRLEDLLETVLSEVMFEMNALVESPDPPARR